MEILGGLIGLLVGGLVIGAIARFALPGPDPLPLWATIALGLAGSFVGGTVIGFAAEDPSAPGAAGTYFVASVLGATFVLFLYRRLVQKRPLTGPEAQQPPLRPRGLRRIATGEQHSYLEDVTDASEEPLQALEKLVALRNAGLVDRAEFDRRKLELVERL